MDILRSVAVELPCEECGGRFRVSLGQILLAQEAHADDVQRARRTRMPGVYYAGLINAQLCEQLVAVWDQIASGAHAQGGELIVVTDTESA